MSIGILVTLPGNVVDFVLLFGHIRPEYFPVITSVLKLYLTIQNFSKVLADFAATSEQSVPHLAFKQNLLHHRSICV